jgi:hypothetical protein
MQARIHRHLDYSRLRNALSREKHFIAQELKRFET